MELLISFIVPVYKVEGKYLRECIESLLAINYPGIEYIFVDDGSPDKSGQICEEYETIDKRVRVIHKKNEGVSVARNMGIDLAKGTYVTFVDADDWVESDKYELIIQHVIESKYDVYFHGQYIDYKNQNPIEIRPFVRDMDLSTTRDMLEVKKMVFVRDYGSLKTNIGAGVICNAVDKFIKRSILIDNNIRFDPEMKMGEDALFNLQVFMKCRNAFYIDICVYHYRMRASSANHSRNQIGFSNIPMFYNKARAMITMNHEDEILLISLYYRCFGLIFEQFEPSYISVKGVKLGLKIKLLSEELRNEPFSSSIKTIKLSQVDIIEKIKAIILKMHLGWAYLLIKDFKRRVFNDEYKKEKYY